MASWLSREQGLAPSLTSSSAIEECPAKAASWRGVRWFSPTTSTLAPLWEGGRRGRGRERKREGGGQGEGEGEGEDKRERGGGGGGGGERGRGREGEREGEEGGREEWKYIGA